MSKFMAAQMVKIAVFDPQCGNVLKNAISVKLTL